MERATSRSPTPHWHPLAPNERDFRDVLDTYFVTISRPERIDVLRKLVQHFGDQLVLLPQAYTTNHTAVGNRFKHIGGRGPNCTEGWNAEQWEITS